MPDKIIPIDPTKALPEYTHGEAFNIMLYICEVCGSMEILWNSRDGVTPFMINCRYCKGSMQHSFWHMDRKMPDFKPHDGMRIFIDLTKERHDYYINKRIDIFWNNDKFPMKERYASKAEAFEALTKEWDPDKGEPDVIIYDVVKAGAKEASDVGSAKHE